MMFSASLKHIIGGEEIESDMLGNDTHEADRRALACCLIAAATSIIFPINERFDSLNSFEHYSLVSIAQNSNKTGAHIDDEMGAAAPCQMHLQRSVYTI